MFFQYFEFIIFLGCCVIIWFYLYIWSSFLNFIFFRIDIYGCFLLLFDLSCFFLLSISATFPTCSLQLPTYPHISPFYVLIHIYRWYLRQHRQILLLFRRVVNICFVYLYLLQLDVSRHFFTKRNVGMLIIEGFQFISKFTVKFLSSLRPSTPGIFCFFAMISDVFYFFEMVRVGPLAIPFFKSSLSLYETNGFFGGMGTLLLKFILQILKFFCEFVDFLLLFENMYFHVICFLIKQLSFFHFSLQFFKFLMIFLCFTIFLTFYHPIGDFQLILFLVIQVFKTFLLNCFFSMNCPLLQILLNYVII